MRRERDPLKQPEMADNKGMARRGNSRTAGAEVDDESHAMMDGCGSKCGKGEFERERKANFII